MGAFRRVCILPSKAVAKDMSMSGRDYALAIAVHSYNITRLTPVIDALFRVYISELDVRRAWIRAAMVADEVNLDIAEGIPADSRCGCHDITANTELHCCEQCTRPTICKMRFVSQ